MHPCKKGTSKVHLGRLVALIFIGDAPYSFYLLWKAQVYNTKLHPVISNDYVVQQKSPHCHDTIFQAFLAHRFIIFLAWTFNLSYWVLRAGERQFFWPDLFILCTWNGQFSQKPPHTINNIYYNILYQYLFHTSKMLID